MANDKSRAVYGIDLGTTYSCIAQVNKFDEAVVLRNFEGDATTPSVVYFESESNMIVGKEAKSMLWEAGYNVGDIMRDEDISAANQNDCKVYKQEPNQAEELAWGEKVTIYITTDGEKVKRGVSESDRIYQERLAEKLAADSLALEAD